MKEQLADFTDDQIECRLEMIEGMIHKCKDQKSLPHLNKMFQDLIDEQVRRDMEREDE